jgi:hypothetical protein
LRGRSAANGSPPMTPARELVRHPPLQSAPMEHDFRRRGRHTNGGKALPPY